MRSTTADDRAAIGELDEDECLVLLLWEIVGRLATAAVGEAPLVVPINFVVDGNTIVFRSGEGQKLSALTRQPVSLQVDRFDWYRRIGWSVLVQGVAEEIHPDIELELEPWAPGHKPHVIRIVPTSITGRRIELTTPPLDGRAYV